MGDQRTFSHLEANMNALANAHEHELAELALHLDSSGEASNIFDKLP